MSRRFILIYQREGAPATRIEGVQFSTKRLVIELDPGSDRVGAREFSHISVMERYVKHLLHEFGTTSIEWLDEEAVME